jgi:hypothetical protein
MAKSADTVPGETPVEKLLLDVVNAKFRNPSHNDKLFQKLQTLTPEDQKIFLKTKTGSSNGKTGLENLLHIVSENKGTHIQQMMPLLEILQIEPRSIELSADILKHIVDGMDFSHRKQYCEFAMKVEHISKNPGVITAITNKLLDLISTEKSTIKINELLSQMAEVHRASLHTDESERQIKNIQGRLNENQWSYLTTFAKRTTKAEPAKPEPIKTDAPQQTSTITTTSKPADDVVKASVATSTPATPTHEERKAIHVPTNLRDAFEKIADQGEKTQQETHSALATIQKQFQEYVPQSNTDFLLASYTVREEGKEIGRFMGTVAGFGDKSGIAILLENIDQTYEALPAILDRAKFNENAGEATKHKLKNQFLGINDPDKNIETMIKLMTQTNLADFLPALEEHLGQLRNKDLHTYILMRFGDLLLARQANLKEDTAKENLQYLLNHFLDANPQNTKAMDQFEQFRANKDFNAIFENVVSSGMRQRSDATHDAPLTQEAPETRSRSRIITDPQSTAKPSPAASLPETEKKEEHTAASQRRNSIG